MKRTLFTSLLSALSLASAAQAQEALPSLAQARTAFAAADADKSGGVSLDEAQRNGHSLAEFRGFDLDGNGALSQDEFLVGYKERMSTGGRRVASDLDNEARRILTERRAAQAEDARRRSAESGAGPAARRNVARQEFIESYTGDPQRIRNHLQDKKPGTETPANDPKERAADALRSLQERNTPAPNADKPAATAGPAPAPTAKPSEAPRPANTPDAPNATNGPAAQRRSPEAGASPEELQRLLRERRQRAAESGSDDPRAEEDRARERAADEAGAARREGRTPSREAERDNGRGGRSSGRAPRARSNGPRPR
jgi:hypothetical protein